MLPVLKRALHCCVFLFLSSYLLGVSHSKTLSISCSEEPDDVISKTVTADVILIGSVSKIFSSSLSESCAEIEKVELLKGELETEPLIVCRTSLKCDETLLDEQEKYIVFLNSTKSRDKEIEDEFYLMASSPLPYSVKTSDNILEFLGDTSIGQPPEIKIPEKSLINESFGDRANLTCFFNGFPTPIIQWRKDGSILQPSDNIRIKTNKSHSILELSELHVDLIGNYECFAQNVFGSDSITFNVTSYKMHAHPCPDNSFCFTNGICYISDRHMLCECKSGFGGQRCQLAEGEVKEAKESDYTSKSIQTLLLIITVAVVVTGVVILLYATFRSFYIGANYKKIKPNSSSRLLQSDEQKCNTSMKTNGNTVVDTVVPIEAAKVQSSQSPRERLNGTSTPTFFGERVWNSRTFPQDTHVDAYVQTPPPLLTFTKSAQIRKNSNTSTYDEVVSEFEPMKTSVI